MGSGHQPFDQPPAVLQWTMTRDAQGYEAGTRDISPRGEWLGSTLKAKFTRESRKTQVAVLGHFCPLAACSP